MTHTTSSSRDISLDILRIIGFFCIILAHVKPEEFLYNLREFDVSLMVVLSGYLFQLTNKKKEGKFSFLWYIKKRFVRLVLPTWIFFTFFFGVFSLLDIYKLTPFPFSFDTIEKTYFLWTGIGYVWIIRIYLGVALLWPLLVWLFSKIKYKYTLLTFLFIGYEFLWNWFSKSYFWDYKDIITRGVFFLLPYLLLFLYGVFFREQKLWKKIFLIALGMFLFFQQNISQGAVINLQDYKYPAHGAYLLYGITMSSIFLLWAEISKKIQYGFLEKPLLWLWSSTLMLYLTHIPFVYYFDNYTTEISWKIKLLYVVIGAIISTWVIQTIAYSVIKLFSISPKYAKTIKTIFCS